MTHIISLPYGRGRIACAVPQSRQVHILRPGQPAAEPEPAPTHDEAALIAAALAAPINSPPLAALARGRKKVVIITSDHTRPVPSHLILPQMCAEIRKGSPEADITVLIAVGSHRATTQAEMEEKFGADFVAREKIVNHNPHDPEGLVSLGRLPSGGELVLNKLAAEADLLLADGFIEPHQFAGFSGGRKSVLPGIAGLATVLASHNAEFTVHPQARPGSLAGNPFQDDMLFAARAAKLAFIVNVTLDGHRVEAAFAGEPEAAHLAGCERVTRRCGVAADPAPVVISGNGGYPLDRNIYQATKSMMAADLCCATGGVIIMVNECADGHGAEAFHRDFRGASPAGLLAEIQGRGRNDTRPDQWVTQLTASILARRTVIAVSGAEPGLLRDFGLIPAPSLEAALSLADEITGLPMGPINVLPEAVALIIN